jgi:hypothetical protein
MHKCDFAPSVARVKVGCHIERVLTVEKRSRCSLLPCEANTEERIMRHRIPTLSQKLSSLMTGFDLCWQHKHHGCPAKGGYHGSRQRTAHGNRQHRTRPCKSRKDGAPSLHMASTNAERMGHSPVSKPGPPVHFLFFRFHRLPRHSCSLRAGRTSAGV